MSIKMGKILTPYDKEYMKIAMLKHEETFKEQVYELHRLYRIQKQLMKNISSTRSNGQNQNRFNSKNGTNLNQIIFNAHHQKLQQNLENLDGNGEVEIEDENEIELTLGPSSFNSRRKLERPLNSDSGASFSFSSSSSGSDHHIKRVERAREGQNRQNWGIVRNASSGEEEEEELRQDRLQQSPWLFQVLSLNVT